MPPASQRPGDNVQVGHGIRFYADTPSGVCNSDCFDWGTNSYARCFSEKVLVPVNPSIARSFF